MPAKRCKTNNTKISCINPDIISMIYNEDADSEEDEEADRALIEVSRDLVRNGYPSLRKFVNDHLVTIDDLL